MLLDTSISQRLNFLTSTTPLTEGKYDIDGELRINRINFELGISGPMEFHLVSPQIDNYIQYESGMEADLGSFNATPTALTSLSKFLSTGRTRNTPYC